MEGPCSPGKEVNHEQSDHSLEILETKRGAPGVSVGYEDQKSVWVTSRGGSSSMEGSEFDSFWASSSAVGAVRQASWLKIKPRLASQDLVLDHQYSDKSKLD